MKSKKTFSALAIAVAAGSAYLLIVAGLNLAKLDANPAWRAWLIIISAFFALMSIGLEAENQGLKQRNGELEKETERIRKRLEDLYFIRR